MKRSTGPLVNGWVPPAGSNPATYLYYEGWNLIQEGSQSGNAERQYVHGAQVDEVLAQVTSGNVPSYFHYDAMNNCTLQTDAGGAITEQYCYDAFGYPYFYNASGHSIGYYDSQNLWRGYSPSGNRFLFTGREWLSELKLYDYRNRMYQPELGRFLQPDPKQFAAGDYNLYRYCHNDPVNRVDPFGLYAPEIRGFNEDDAKKVQAQIDQLKDKSQAFRDQFKKWEGDKENREIRPASDPGNFKGRNQSPTRNGPGNSTERESLLSRIASLLRGGQGRGGTIYFNPNNRATSAPGSDRAPVFGLAHEFGHLIDIGNGNYPSSLIPSAAETRAGENTAIGWENEARSAIGGVDLRPYQ